jgi:hypothetical protein
LSIYAGQQDAVQEYAKVVPSVLASAWRSPDGDVGIVLASISDTPTTVSAALSRKDYPIPESGKLHQLTDRGPRDAVQFTGGVVELVIRLEPYDVRVYEITGS